MRAWRRESRRLLARLWLGLAALAEAKGSWEDERVYFEEAIEEPGLRSVFETDYKADAAALDRLDFSILQSAVVDVAGRLDSHAVVHATVLGTIGGTIGGSLITLVAG
jgi:hypothetical protein